MGNLDAAKAHAVVAAGEMLTDQGLKVWKTRNYYMFVADEKNRTCIRLAFNVEDLRVEQKAH